MECSYKNTERSEGFPLGSVLHVTFDTIRARPLDHACEDAEDASESEAEGDFYFLFFIVLLLLPPVIV